MEILILLVIVVLIYQTSNDNEKFVKIKDLKVGSNPNSHYDKEAFTEVYYLRRTNK